MPKPSVALPKKKPLPPIGPPPGLLTKFKKPIPVVPLQSKRVPAKPSVALPEEEPLLPIVPPPGPLAKFEEPLSWCLHG